MTEGTAMQASSMRAGVVVPFVLIALIWGSTWLVIKYQIGVVPAGWSATWRFAVGSVGMVLLTKLRGESLWLPQGGMRLAAVVGLTQFCINFQFVYRSEHYLTSGLVAVLFALLMVPNALFSRIFLKTPIGGRFIAGSAVALAGIGLLLLHEYRVAPPQASVPMGILLAICGLCSASIGNVMQASEAARKMPVVPMIAWAMIWGALGSALFSLIVSGPPVFDPRPEYYAGVLYLAIIGSVVTFPLYFGLIRNMGAGKAAYNGVAVPVIAMGLSTLFEGYHWSLLAASGAVLAMIGLLIALSARRA
jgi:drug/metabolite transporter (DMT)-like permease